MTKLLSLLELPVKEFTVIPKYVEHFLAFLARKTVNAHTNEVRREIPAQQRSTAAVTLHLVPSKTAFFSSDGHQLRDLNHLQYRSNKNA